MNCVSSSMWSTQAFTYKLVNNVPYDLYPLPMSYKKVDDQLKSKQNHQLKITLYLTGVPDPHSN